MGARAATARVARRRRARRPALSFKAATPARWADVERLFGPRGAVGGCWCMYWRWTSAEFSRRRGAGARRAFRRIVKSNGQPGVLAYADGQPVGWCAVGPRAEYPRLGRSRVLAPVDDRPVWAISCLYVARPWRRRGVSGGLIKAAAAFARRRGARILEGYPVEPRTRALPDIFAWTGFSGAFRRAGFREVLRRSPTRPIVRCVLR